MNIWLVAFLLLLAVGALYWWGLRPRLLRWGATQAEVRQSLPGDDVVKKPHFIATRAVTIDAPATEVWRWIIQIGSARAGWYSHDWIDNGRVPSTREILTQFQKIEEGYFIPFTPDQKNGMWVKEYQEPEYILWWDKKGNGTWGWYLRQDGTGPTRLITRLRTKYDFRFPWFIYYVLYDSGDIIMMRKCMLGIKERAENNARNAFHSASSQ